MLLGMGFDLAASRAAIAAAGGDIERAVRLVLEDSRAHDSFSAAEWEFEGDAGWVPYDTETEALLQAAVEKGLSACEIVLGGRRYLVDFDSLMQLNLGSGRTRRIRKRSTAGTVVPPTQTSEP